MVVGILRIGLHVVDCQSLKDKRSIVSGLLRRLSNRFNAAVAEIDDHDLWQRGTLGIAVIGSSTAHAHSQLQSVMAYVEREPDVVIIDMTTELL